MLNPCITIKSNQFAGKKYSASEFLKKQRNRGSKFLLDTLQPKKKKKKKKKKRKTRVLRVYRKNNRKGNYG